METVSDFIFWGSRITVDGDYSHEIKRHLLLGRKAMTNLDSILKSRDMTLQAKVCLVKAMVFPVVMHRCESWSIKKSEHKRIDTFELLLLMIVVTLFVFFFFFCILNLFSKNWNEMKRDCSNNILYFVVFRTLLCSLKQWGKIWIPLISIQMRNYGMS